jgi:cell division protein FtsA
LLKKYKKMNKNDNYILGLDIGCSKIMAAICKIDFNNDLDFCGIGSSITAGMKKGKVKNFEEFFASVEKAIKRAAEYNGGIIPQRVITNIPLAGVEFLNVSGKITKDTTTEITYRDRNECLRQAKTKINFKTKRVMHLIPIGYSVDGIPVDTLDSQVGRELEIDVLAVLGDVENISLVTQVLGKLDLKLKGIVYDALSQGEVLLSDQQRQKGCYLFNFGGRFCEVSFLKNNVLQKSIVIPIGGETITADIAYCLNVSVPEAERLKIIYGDVDLANFPKEESIEIMLKDNTKKQIKRKLLCQIIEARVAELIKLVFSKLDFGKDLAAKELVVGGGSSKLNGVEDYLVRKMRLVVKREMVNDQKNTVDSLSCNFAVGAILYAIRTGVVKYSHKPSKLSFDSLHKKLRKNRRIAKLFYGKTYKWVNILSLRLVKRVSLAMRRSTGFRG